MQGTAYALLVGGQDRRQGLQHLLQHPKRRLAAAIERHDRVEGVEEVPALVGALDGLQDPGVPLLVGRLHIRERVREDLDEVRVEAVVCVRAAKALQEGRGVQPQGACAHAREVMLEQGVFELLDVGHDFLRPLSTRPHILWFDLTVNDFLSSRQNKPLWTKTINPPAVLHNHGLEQQYCFAVLSFRRNSQPKASTHFRL